MYFPMHIDPFNAKTHYCNFAVKGVKKKPMQFSLYNNVNAVVLGQMYQSMLSSFLRIPLMALQYLPI